MGGNAGAAAYDLKRFRKAQEADYDRALAEMRAGRKQSHWIWYVFPQLRGLGRSWMAQHYAIAGIGEARAYLADPVLGGRLREITQAALALGAADPVEVMGDIDAVKLRSCLTLFREAAGPGDDRVLFQALLDAWYDGEPDRLTLRMLGRDGVA